MDALPAASIHRILAVNFGGIGDAVLFFPTLQTLRRHFPHAHITVLVEPRCREIMERQYLVEGALRPGVNGRLGPGERAHVGLHRVSALLPGPLGMTFHLAELERASERSHVPPQDVDGQSIVA